MQGIIVLNKPKGWTSFDCAAVVRRVSGEKRCGHTGTLDPDASGVLPVCIGNAAKLIEYMGGGTKLYRCRCRLGIETDTQDTSGNVTGGVLQGCAPSDFLFPPEEKILEALSDLTGEIVQTPPIYSAIKVNGKRLYKYAREGKNVEIPSRRVVIYNIDMLSYDRKAGELSMDIECSGGTYIRTICHDLGRILCTGGVMANLIRLKTSGFDISEAVDAQRVKFMGTEEFANHLFPIERGAAALRRLEINARQKKLFLHGAVDFAKDSCCLDFSDPEEKLAVFSEGVLLGIASLKFSGGRLCPKPLKVFL